MATVSNTRDVDGQISYIPRKRGGGGGGYERNDVPPLARGGGLGVYPEKMLES